MTPEDIRKWAEEFPVKKNEAASWHANKKILKAITQRHTDGLQFAFGTDISIRFDSLWPKDMVGTKRALEKALDAYAQNGGDAQWAQKTKRELDILQAPYFSMLEMHGLKAPDGTWVKEGVLSDVLEYRYGTALHGIGWHDEKDVLEVRTKPMEPLEFIAAYHRIVNKLEKRGGDIGHIHLHVSAWVGGKPFQPGARNIFDMANEEDLKKTKGALAALSYAQGHLAGVAPLRGYNVPIRAVKGRAEIRSIILKPHELHMAKEILETMCSVRYGIKHPDAAHFPRMTMGERPSFRVPEHPELQIELNQADFSQNSGIVDTHDNVFQLANIGGKPVTNPRPMQPHVVYPPPYVKILVKKNGSTPVVSVEKEALYDAMVPEDARAALEVLLKKSFSGMIPTIATPGTHEMKDMPKFERFENDPAFKEHMPAAVFRAIANSYRHDDDLPPKREGRAKG